jgi:DNA topoisomerase-3
MSMGLINACDAGREGELIFNYIAQHSQNRQAGAAPVAAVDDPGRHPRRLRPPAPGARDGRPRRRRRLPFRIRLAGRHQRHAGDDRLQLEDRRLPPDHRRPRADADAGHRRRARKEIREFKPRDYWEVEAEFAAKAGSYNGKWFDEGFKGKNDDEHARADRLWEQDKADAIRAATLGKPGIVTEEAKPETRLSPLLFDLTSLQREANARFGFSAKTTLSLAQALYEKHKVLTYPRTDSRCLPEDYLATVKETLTVSDRRRRRQGP